MLVRPHAHQLSWFEKAIILCVLSPFNYCQLDIQKYVQKKIAQKMFVNDWD
jgi:hypothetical protein